MQDQHSPQMEHWLGVREKGEIADEVSLLRPSTYFFARELLLFLLMIRQQEWGTPTALPTGPQNSPTTDLIIPRPVAPTRSASAHDSYGARGFRKGLSEPVAASTTAFRSSGLNPDNLCGNRGSAAGNDLGDSVVVIAPGICCGSR